MRVECNAGTIDVDVDEADVFGHASATDGLEGGIVGCPVAAKRWHIERELELGQREEGGI